VKTSHFNLYVLFGWISFGVGIVGIVTPILPTVPFFLLASWCFSKGSPKFHAWIRDHKYAGPIIHDWEEHRSISKKSKIKAIITIVISFAISIAVVKPLGLKIMLICIGVAVSTFILTRKSR
jgi:uncharacterized membrane protein YbaN (DUF454 family)